MIWVQTHSPLLGLGGGGKPTMLLFEIKSWDIFYCFTPKGYCLLNDCGAEKEGRNKDTISLCFTVE